MSQAEWDRLAKYRGGGGGGESSQSGRWAEVGKRIDVAYDAIGHPQQLRRPVEEGRHYTTLAYTDWADSFVPTVVKWNHGAVDDFSDRARSMENQAKAVSLERERDLKRAVTEMKKAAREEKERYGKPGPMTLRDLRLYQAELRKEREKRKASGMSRSIKLPVGGGTLKVRGREYVWRGGDADYKAAQKKAEELRSRGYKAVIRKERVAGKPAYVIYTRKEEER